MIAVVCCWCSNLRGQDLDVIFFWFDERRGNWISVIGFQQSTYKYLTMSSFSDTSKSCVDCWFLRCLFIPKKISYTHGVFEVFNYDSQLGCVKFAYLSQISFFAFSSSRLLGSLLVSGNAFISSCTISITRLVCVPQQTFFNPNWTSSNTQPKTLSSVETRDDDFRISERIFEFPPTIMDRREPQKVY